MNLPDPYDPTRPAPILEAPCAKVVEYLLRNGPARRGIVARALDIPPGTLANRIMRWRLAEHGVVATVRSGANGRRQRVTWLMLDGHDERTLPPRAPARRCARCEP